MFLQDQWKHIKIITIADSILLNVFMTGELYYMPAITGDR